MRARLPLKLKENARASGLGVRRARGVCASSTGTIAAALVGVMVIGPAFGNTGIAEELAQAKQRSAQLESTLQDYDPENRVMSGQEAELTARLEDQIAQVDGRLAELDALAAREAQLVDLWRQRVDLMRRLVQVRVARAKYVGL